MTEWPAFKGVVSLRGVAGLEERRVFCGGAPAGYAVGTRPGLPVVTGPPQKLSSAIR